MKDAILDQLRTVQAEGLDSDIVSAGLVSDIAINDGKVIFSITVPAGFTGEIDWARVMSQGGVELGLAGASIGGGLTNLALTDLIGQLFNVEVSVAGFGFDVARRALDEE